MLKVVQPLKVSLPTVVPTAKELSLFLVPGSLPEIFRYLFFSSDLYDEAAIFDFMTEEDWGE